MRGPSMSASPRMAPVRPNCWPTIRRRDVVLEAVDRLKPEHRAVIVLRYFVDRNYEDMGEILGIDAKTVKSRLYTARQLLKEQLALRGAL